MQGKKPLPDKLGCRKQNLILHSTAKYFLLSFFLNIYIFIYVYYIQCISYAYFEIQIRKVMRKLLLDNFSKFSSSKLPLVKLTFLNRIFAPVQCHHHPPKWPLHSHIDTLKNNEDQGSGI